MPANLDFDYILDALRNGAADGREDELYEALDARRALRAASVITQLRVGQRVVCAPRVKPKHLALANGTVEELKPRTGKVMVRWDHRPHEVWTMGASVLVPVPEGATV